MRGTLALTLTVASILGLLWVVWHAGKGLGMVVGAVIAGAL